VGSLQQPRGSKQVHSFHTNKTWKANQIISEGRMRRKTFTILYWETVLISPEALILGSSASWGLLSPEQVPALVQSSPPAVAHLHLFTESEGHECCTGVCQKHEGLTAVHEISTRNVLLPCSLQNIVHFSPSALYNKPNPTAAAGVILH